MTAIPLFSRRRVAAAEHPVELRFVDMLLIIIATVMLLAILLSVVSAFRGSGQPNMAPQVMTRSAPDAIAGQPYELTLAVHGGDGQYRWEHTGSLPDGLRLDPDKGVIEGTPRHQQTTGIGVRVTDGSGRASATTELMLAVHAVDTSRPQQIPPRILGATTLLDGGEEGDEYRHMFAADGGTSPYSWTSDDRPGWLALASDGTLSGRTEAGVYSFTVTTTDAAGVSARHEYQLTVRDKPSLFKRIFDWAYAWIIYPAAIIYIVVIILIGSRGFSGAIEFVRRKRATRRY